MSSKRGRKRNDNLPPNRARDVQRAFRARRAAHLQALEDRVSELEEENNCLRQALSLPPANRPPLGKGPTGKDKPKGYDASCSMTWSRDSSSADSPGSLRGGSVSPILVSNIIPPRPNVVQDIQNGTGAWGQTIVMTDDVPQYQLPPMSTPPSFSSSKSMSSYSPPYPSPSRSSMYMYGSSERSVPTYPPHLEQRSYSYSVQQQSHSSHSSPYEDAGREVAAPSSPLLSAYLPRRATADFLGGTYPSASGIRLPSPPRGLGERMQDSHSHHHHFSHHDLHPHHRPAYTADGHIVPC